MSKEEMDEACIVCKEWMYGEETAIWRVCIVCAMVSFESVVHPVPATEWGLVDIRQHK